MGKFKASNGYLVAGGTISRRVEYARSDAKGERVDSVTWPALLALVEYAATLGVTADASRAAVHQTAEQETSELTDRSLDGRGDERGRCPSVLDAGLGPARCALDRGHEGAHQSIRMEAVWSRDEPMVATLTPAGPEWEEFQAWKADKERAELLETTDGAVRDLFRFADRVTEFEADGVTDFEGFREMVRELFKLHEAGTIDLSIYDEGKSE